jgi:hypothetical protein
MFSGFLFTRYGHPILMVKQIGHKADHSPPFSAETENEKTYTSYPPYAFKACIWTTNFLASFIRFQTIAVCVC